MSERLTELLRLDEAAEVSIAVDLALGRGKATAWTCDLTHGYIDINGAYRS